MQLVDRPAALSGLRMSACVLCFLYGECLAVRRPLPDSCVTVSICPARAAARSVVRGSALAAGRLVTLSTESRFAGFVHLHGRRPSEMAAKAHSV